VKSELRNNLDTGRFSGKKLSSAFIIQSQVLLLSDDDGRACRQKIRSVYILGFGNSQRPLV